ncbi:transposable element Tcb1 transposase [Trichonephila clavipes]|nr:transposable element Tcb1 transposase [Trichonephila clavipes]
MSTRTIRRDLQRSGMSARPPLFNLPLTGNYRSLRRRWCDEWWTETTEWNDIVFAVVCRQHHDTIELLPWPACSPDLSPIENAWSMFAQRLPRDTLSTATPDQLWQYVDAAWTAVLQGYIQSLFDSMPRRMAAVITNNGGILITDFSSTRHKRV